MKQLMPENGKMCETVSPSQGLEIVATTARCSCTSAVTSPNAAFPLAVIYSLKREERYAEHLQEVRYKCTSAPPVLHPSDNPTGVELSFQFVTNDSVQVNDSLRELKSPYPLVNQDICESSMD